MLMIEADGKAIKLPHVAGKAANVHLLADRLRKALNLPGRSPRGAGREPHAGIAEMAPPAP
jgi:hypothetical protein